MPQSFKPQWDGLETAADQRQSSDPKLGRLRSAPSLWGSVSVGPRGGANSGVTREERMPLSV
jgi:hypothetical protein